jgi:parallel beta-helix repeat protein
MKGQLFFASCLLLLLFSLLVVGFSQPKLNASNILPVHDLNTGLSYATIQDAINANETFNGDTIEIDSGVYYESINVNKSLTLVGENADTTILDGNGTGVQIGSGALPYGHAVIALGADNISILNLTMMNAGQNNVLNSPGRYDACISCEGEEHNIDIEGNILQNAGAPIICGNGVSSVTVNNNTVFNTTGLAIDVGGETTPTATNVTITSNTVYDAQLVGINLDGDTSNCTISNNTVLSCYDGIDVHVNKYTGVAPANVTVSDNFVQDCSEGGIGLSGGIQNSTVLNNTVEDSLIGIFLVNDGGTELAPYDNLIEGNTLSNNNGTNLLYLGQTDIGDTQPSYTNTFRGNNLTNTQSSNLMIWSWNLGAFMQEIDTSNIANNQKIYYLTNLSNVEVDPSNLPDASSLTLVDCNGITVKDFNFSQNNDGLILAGSTGCALTNITVANNQIYLMNDMNADELGPNNGGPAYGGLSLVYSTNNTINESTMYNNTCGVWLCWSNGNIFYDNNFINNNYQVFNGMAFPTTPSTCSWNNTIEGNYWSDYNGSYINQDGIGDTPYIIDSSNTDHYPLMGMLNSFKATSQCSVETVSNSTISDFQFNGTAISFNATEGNGTTGFCRVSIPTALINGTLKVLVNGMELSYTLLPESSNTENYLYFTYHHSTQQVIITMPEFPSFLILVLFIAATLWTATAFQKKTEHRKSGL